jgi:hypothetical protein
MVGFELGEQDWNIRLFIYKFFVENCRPPTPVETSRAFDLSSTETRDAYYRLHQKHAIFVDGELGMIRMANPLSAVATPYQVTVGPKSLYANCAWDSIGIPAMLHSNATVNAFIDGSDAPVTYTVKNGKLIAPPELVVHFSVPFKQWYDDQIHT